MLTPDFEMIGRFAGGDDDLAVAHHGHTGGVQVAGVILVAGARDTAAIQIKLDELIRAVADTDELLIGIEDRSAEELELLRQDKAPLPPA